MLKHKRLREKGKLSFTRFFQQFKEGDSVALVRDLSFTAAFPKRMQGRTGTVLTKRKSAYVVEVMDINMKKQYVIRPIHLKRIMKAGAQ